MKKDGQIKQADVPWSNTPGLGVALIVVHQQRLLLGRRKNQPMINSWQLPGGWIAYHESPLQAVERLLRAFPEIEYDDVKFVCYTDNQFDQGLHSVSLYFQVTCLNSEPLQVPDNDCGRDWFWADWYDLPDPLFLPLRLLKQSGFEPTRQQ